MSRFSRNRDVGGWVVAIKPKSIYTETAFGRARRTAKAVIMHSFRHVLWLSICAIAAGGVGAALTANSTKPVYVGLITAAAGLGGLVGGLISSFVVVWAGATKDQRDELRERLFELETKFEQLTAKEAAKAMMLARYQALIQRAEWLFDAQVDQGNKAQHERWIADHGAWREQLDALPEADRIRVYDYSGFTDVQPEWEKDVRPAKARVGRILSNLRALHEEYHRGER